MSWPSTGQRCIRGTTKPGVEWLKGKEGRSRVGGLEEVWRNGYHSTGVKKCLRSLLYDYVIDGIDEAEAFAGLFTI